MSDKTEPSDDELLEWANAELDEWHDGLQFRAALRVIFRAGVATHNTVSREQIAKALRVEFHSEPHAGHGTDWLTCYLCGRTLDVVLVLLVPTSKETK